MSIGVELEDLARRLAEYGSVAFLVTVGDGGHPHVVSVAVELADDELATSAGRTSVANLASRPDVTLVWPTPDGGDYCLIVDGSGRLVDAAEEGGGTVRVAPVRAVLHRLAGAPTSEPSCVTLLDRRPGRSSG